MLHLSLWGFLISFTLCLQRNVIHGDSCDENKISVCDRLSKLQTTVDANTEYLRKWSPHYEFLKRLSNDFEGEISRIVKNVIIGMEVRNAMDGHLANQNEIADILVDMHHLKDAEKRSKEENNKLSLKLGSIEKDIQGFFNTMNKVKNDVINLASATETKSSQLEDELLRKVDGVERSQKEELLLFASVAQDRSWKLKDEIADKMEELERKQLEISVFVLQAENRSREIKVEMFRKMEEFQKQKTDACLNLSSEVEKRSTEVIKEITEAKNVSLQLKDELLKTITEVEIVKQHLQKRSNEEENRSIEILRRLREGEMNTSDVINTVLKQVAQTEKKVNETQQTLISIVSSHKSLEDVIRENISASNENVKQRLLEVQNMQSNLTAKIRTFEAEISKLDTQYASSSYNISKLNETLRTVNSVSETAHQTLVSHSLEIRGLKLQIEAIENGCDNPPKVKYGHLVDRKKSNGTVLTYTCQDNMTLVDRGNVVCLFGEWIGMPPVCMENCNTSDLKGYQGLEVLMNMIHKHSEILKVRCRKGYHTPYSEMVIRCENGQWQVPENPCIKGHFDATFVLRAVTPSDIHCYSYENYNKIEFSRLPEIGSGGNLSNNATKATDQNPATLTFRQILIYDERFGAFQCKIDDENGSFKIVTLMQRGTKYGDFKLLEAFKVANIGDTIEFEVWKVKNNQERPIKWTHNGVQIPLWNDRLKVKIHRVELGDAGIYECYYEGSRHRNLHAFMKLSVRKCGENQYGKNCNQICPKCYNGGICHDDYGMCVCPAGFTGLNCEKACDDGFFGTRCSDGCKWERSMNCSYRLFCKPDPFGCACAAGYRGIFCGEKCDAGWYGADCKQTCHCAKGPDSCNAYTGACAGGCSEGWEGDSCQIECKNNLCGNSQT